MKDILLDIVTHTHPLGRLPDLKIETDADLFWKPDAELDRLALHGAHKKALALTRDQEREPNVRD